MSDETGQDTQTLGEELESQSMASILGKVEQEGGGQQQQEEQAKEAKPKRTACEEWADVYFTFGTIAGVRFPRLKAVYSEDRCLAVQEKLDPIFERNGWNNIEAMGTFMQYAMAGAAVFMLGKDTMDAINADMEDEKVAASRKLDHADE